VTKKNNFPTVRLQDVPMQIPQNGNGGYRPVVLVVDDESVITDSLAAILSQGGYAAISAYDAESALESALLMPPEMLITDVILPGMSGIDLAITIKRIFPDCKIILFSGQASTTDLLNTARQNGHDFELLSKPLHPSVLLTRIAERLAKRKQRTAATV